ncbi:hypothetical protein [Tenacibaculum jejuense]|uniref:Uncharacterized protein n=1 Tax=Tenacibaculum jejuense TaxID=584609 RepID=A0A238UE67_9FLAO|nr:hypothetical protein [Tenacibaculum jejuense]SNR17479.1 conserved protein of unknown function [Tenacibaculum jejuense]
MEQIKTVYTNDIGISFQWVNSCKQLTQVIFRDTGFHLTTNEIELFLEQTIDAKRQKKCSECMESRNCRSLLLRTPSNKVSLAVSMVDLGQIEDLLKGTLFQLKFNDYIEEICKN